LNNKGRERDVDKKVKIVVLELRIRLTFVWESDRKRIREIEKEIDR
jgi:hypothetical protein